MFRFTGILHYLAGGYENQEHVPLRWTSAAFSRPSGNAIIPIIDTTIEQFLAFMQEPNVVEGNTLYVAIRTFARLEAASVVRDDDYGLPSKEFINTLLLAAAIIPGEIEGAVQHNWRYEPLQTLYQLCTIGEVETEPEDPILKTAWRQLATGREQRREHRLVQDRAKRLLETHLDETQLAEFKKKHRFRVTGQDGLVYLVTYGTHGNVWLIEHNAEGKPIPRKNFCIVPTEDVPIYDQMLAQKFMIETVTDEFKRIANVAEFDDEGNRIHDGEAGVEPEEVEQRIEAGDPQPGPASRADMGGSGG